MIEKFEYKGLWFLPSKIENKVHGILKYDYENDINILELIGGFNDLPNYDIVDIILGITTEGDEITLVECYCTYSTEISTYESDKFKKQIGNRFTTMNFKIELILKGHHIFNKEDLLFQKIYAEIFNLDEWIGISGLEVVNNYENRTIYYKNPNPIYVKISDDLDLEIKFTSNHLFKSRLTKELRLSQRTILSIHSKKHITLDEFIYLLNKFNNFISASLQKPVRIQSMKFCSDKFFKNQGNTKIEKVIYGYKIINPELKFKEKRQDWQMIFTYYDIKNDFEAIIQKWFSNYQKFEAPMNLVLNQYYISQYFLENLFLNVAQAAESFHRRLELIDDTPKREQDKEFSSKVTRIVENAPEDLKNWVISQISKPPKHFYDTRLQYILKEFSNVELDKIIGNHSNFIKDITKSRNYYTHYNKDQEKGALGGIELIRLYKKLRFLLICGFLIESGFDKKLLEKLIKEKSTNLFIF